MTLLFVVLRPRTFATVDDLQVMLVQTGTLVTRLRMPPFIVTLGTWGALRGAAKGLAHEQMVVAPGTWLNGLLNTLGEGRRWQLPPPGVWMLLGLALLMAGVLRYTRLGRHFFAVGSNAQAARLCGVRVERTQLAVYMLGSGLAGLAGVLQFSYLTVGDPTTATGLELDVIAAVIIVVAVALDRLRRGRGEA